MNSHRLVQPPPSLAATTATFLSINPTDMVTWGVGWGQIRAGSGEIAGEWVSIAVLAEKSRTKETKTGKKFCVWTLSDLNRAEVIRCFERMLGRERCGQVANPNVCTCACCLPQFNLYLFDDAYRAHWKESLGAIFGVLNASVMPDRVRLCRSALVLTDSVADLTRTKLTGATPHNCRMVSSPTASHASTSISAPAS
jgi:hypothetical protein